MKRGSRTHKLKRLYKVGLSRRMESSKDEGLCEEDASKQGRIADIDTDVGIKIVSTHFDADTNMFRVHHLVGDVVVVETEVASKDVNLKQGTITTTTSAITIIAASTRPKAKGLVIHEQEQAPTPTVSLQQPSQLNKSKLFVQLLEARKKHFAAIRAQEKRNKPPTKAQKRNTMSTYLKNMAGYKQNQVKNKSFDDIQKLFDKAMKRMFIPLWVTSSSENSSPQPVAAISSIGVVSGGDMDTELVEGSEVRAEGSEVRVEGSEVRAESVIAQESSSKRAGTELEQESIKKQKVDEDKETAKLQRLIEVVPDKEEVAVDA
ncbi:hypothetical protein Tco_0865427, partial [Tanacetum coccineum]